MVTSTSHSLPFLEASQPMLLWWGEQWLKSAVPIAKLHLAWLESVTEAMQIEAAFFQAMAESGEKLTQCFSYSGGNHSPAALNSCYHEIMQTLTDAHFQRLEKVAELSHEFRQCLWEEI